MISGFHLMHASIARTRRTVEALQPLQPNMVAPLYGTGDLALLESSRAFGDRPRFARVGSECEFSSVSSLTPGPKRHLREEGVARPALHGSMVAGSA